MNICVFGDSIAYGCNDIQNGGYTTLLRNYLEAKDQDISVYNLGICGDTSSGLLKRVESEATPREPQIIIFAIGTNDSLYRDTENNLETSHHQFRANLTELIAKARVFTKRIMFVGLVKGDDSLTTPLADSETGKCYTKSSLLNFNQIVKDVCEQNNLPFVEINNQLNNKDFTDGLHPNTQGHQKIFAVVKPVVEKMLQSN